MIDATLAGLERSLAAREISSVELVGRTLAAIERHQSALNAFVSVDPDGALASSALSVPVL